MMTAITIPVPDSIPVHWIWFQVLLGLTFILHILLMNLLLGGSLLTIWNLFRGKDTGTEVKHLPVLAALTINLGVPPLLFVQVLFGQFFYSSSVMMAVFWILVIPLLIIAYYGAHFFKEHIQKNRLAGKISIIISTVFLLYSGFMFVSNSALALRPDMWKEYFINNNGTFLNLADLSVWPRYLHFLVAAVATAALAKAVIAKYFSKPGKKDTAEISVKENMKIFGIATAIQFVTGTWFWLSMPGAVSATFLGGSIHATLLMILVWVSAIMILYFAYKGNVRTALAQVLFQIVLMTVVREISRSSYLSGIFSPSQLVNVNQPGPLAVFVLVFIAGLAVIYYMIQLALKSGTETGR